MTTENRGADACSDHGLGPDLGRRRALWMLGAGLAVTACGAASSDDDSSGSSGDGTGGSGTTDAGSSSGGTSESGSSSSGEVADTGSTGACGSATAWATGGTAAMTMKSCYPDPFAAAPATCTLICSTTEGPCTTETTIEREDVSEGYTGLPVRMGLRFVDEDCNPVVGASVQIWHTKLTGVYSGVTPSGMMCYGDEPDAEDEMFFRGSQTTDADGVVYFDTCFPGWYSGRAVHVHFQAQIDDSSWIVSQLLWDDAMVAEVFAAHAEYQGFGQPDTTNDTDNVIGGEDDKSPYLFDVQRMPDGAMLASKTITIRSGGPGCTAAGSGGGGPGGPPGG